MKVGLLSNQACGQASQNIVKEGLTRKVFRNKDLAGAPVIPAISLFADQFRDANAHSAIVDFSREGQGWMSQGMEFLMIIHFKKVDN